MTLYELAYACRLYSGVAGFDEAYVDMRRELGDEPDLASPVQRQALMKFLNDWRCRISERNFDSLKSLLQGWAAVWIPQLPAPDRDIRELTPPERHTVGGAYQALLRLGAGLRFSHTAAAKTLHALRPQVLPIWDSEIKHAFSVDPRPTPVSSEQLYPAFIEHVAGQLSELERDAQRFHLSLRDVPRTIERDQNSLVKLVDEHAWVTITLGHQIPNRGRLELWLRWCR